jgi:FKBP-type peptidyl-prolyl cis-trans isomerase 2
MRPAKQGDTVRVHYRGRLRYGSVFDVSFDREPVQFTIGKGQVIPGFEEAVVGMNPGDSKTTELPVEKAFGPYREGMATVVHKSQFAGHWHFEPRVGQRVQIPQSDGPPMNVTVTEVTESAVTLDANHPLAGKDLSFDIKLIDIVREAPSKRAVD